MEERDILENVINNEENSKNRKKSTDELKQRLKEQIHLLKSLILQMEWSLDIIKFGNTKCVLPSSTSSDLNIKVPDTNIRLEAELYRYSGLYCVKYSEEEYVFHLSSSYKYDKKNISAVQILNDQNKGTLGKWFMPMGIDLNDIISDCPITDLKNLPYFLRICKQHVNAYFVRQQQYTTLMNTVSRLKNCSVQTNVGYTQIALELLGVHNENTDSYINIIMYLFYEINAARPNSMKIESLTQDEIDQNTEQHLETSLIYFKNYNLHIAFEKMWNMKGFTWIKEDDEDSPLEISVSNSSNDDEGYLNDFSLHQKFVISQKKKSKTRKKRKIKNQDKLSTPKISSIREYSKEANSLHNKKQDLQNVKEQSVKQQNIDIMNPTPNINDFKQRRLKQTRLKFHLNDSELRNSNNATSSDETRFKRKKTNQQIDKPCTSTPVRQSGPLFNFINDISDITVDVTKKNNPENQIQNDTSTKLLQNKMPKKIKSPTRSKVQSSKTVVHERIKRCKK